FFFQAEDGIRDDLVTGVQTCALPIFIEAAREARERLKAQGLTSFVKTTGGKGLHVVFPLAPKAGWDEVKAFARGVAEAMERDNRSEEPRVGKEGGERWWKEHDKERER